MQAYFARSIMIVRLYDSLGNNKHSSSWTPLVYSSFELAIAAVSLDCVSQAIGLRVHLWCARPCRIQVSGAVTFDDMSSRTCSGASPWGELGWCPPHLCQGLFPRSMQIRWLFTGAAESVTFGACFVSLQSTENKANLLFSVGHPNAGSF